MTKAPAGSEDDAVRDPGDTIDREPVTAVRHLRLHYGWVVLVVATLSSFAVLGLGRFGYTMVLPAMQKGLGLSNTLAGSLATANLVGYATMSLVGGALAARFGTRAVLPLGLVIAAVGMALTGVSHGFAEAAWWRLVTGIGTGLTNVPAAALAGAWFARRLRGLASGVVVSGSSIGLILAGPLVPRVLAATGPEGWRTIWWIYGGITAVMAVVAYVLLRNRPADLRLLPVGTLETNAGPGSARGSVGSADKPAPKPTHGRPQWHAIFRSPIVWHLSFVYFCFGLSYLAFMTFFTKHLITAGGYSSPAAGDLFMLMGWCTVISGSLWGGVSDRIGRKWAFAAVCLVQATAYTIFGLWEQPAGFTIAAVIFGFSSWGIPAIMAASCGDLFGARLAPAALGFITLFFAIGMAAGPAVAGAIADATGSFVPAFLLAGGVAMLGAAAAATLGSTVRRV